MRASEALLSPRSSVSTAAAARAAALTLLAFCSTTTAPVNALVTTMPSTLRYAARSPIFPTKTKSPSSTITTAAAAGTTSQARPTMGLFSKNENNRDPRRSFLRLSGSFVGAWARPGAAESVLQRGLLLSRRGAQSGGDDGGTDAEEDGDYEYDDQPEEYDDALDRPVAKRLKQNARVFRQVSWLSWWAQTILSTVAFIILLFSNAVTNRSARGNILGNGVALALGSLVASAASICWTWGYTLKARGWSKLSSLPEVDDAQLRMRNSLKMGLYINVAGMLLALVGAEQIVGTLVAKVLYAQGFQPSVMVGTAGAAEVAQAQFRALDVFIVQANTNTLLSHFCSLAVSLWLLARTPKLAKLAKGIY